MTPSFIDESKVSTTADLGSRLNLIIPGESTEDPSVMPEANPLFYELVVKDSRGEIIRQHQISAPHKYGERYTTVLILQELQKRIILELPDGL